MGLKRRIHTTQKALAVLVAIPGFILNRLNPKEFAVLSFVSSRAVAFERPRTPVPTLNTYTR